MFAITPHGIGQPVAARRIEPGWPLADGETFTVETYQDGAILAADERSLEIGPARPTRDDVNRERDRRIAKGVSIGLDASGRTFVVQTRNERDLAHINGLMAKATVYEQMGLDTRLEFRDADNVVHELTPAEMIEVALDVQNAIEAIHKRAWGLKSGVIPMDYADDKHWL